MLGFFPILEHWLTIARTLFPPRNSSSLHCCSQKGNKCSLCTEKCRTSSMAEILPEGSDAYRANRTSPQQIRRILGIWAVFKFSAGHKLKAKVESMHLVLLRHFDGRKQLCPEELTAALMQAHRLCLDQVPTFIEIQGIKLEQVIEFCVERHADAKVRSTRLVDIGEVLDSIEHIIKWRNACAGCIQKLRTR